MQIKLNPEDGLISEAREIAPCDETSALRFGEFLFNTQNCVAWPREVTHLKSHNRFEFAHGYLSNVLERYRHLGLVKNIEEFRVITRKRDRTVVRRQSEILRRRGAALLNLRRRRHDVTPAGAPRTPERAGRE
jgi:hypothetical protein